MSNFGDGRELPPWRAFDLAAASNDQTASHDPHADPAPASEPATPPALLSRLARRGERGESAANRPVTGLPRGAERLTEAFSAAREKARTVNGAMPPSATLAQRAKSMVRRGGATLITHLVTTGNVLPTIASHLPDTASLSGPALKAHGDTDEAAISVEATNVVINAYAPSPEGADDDRKRQPSRGQTGVAEAGVVEAARNKFRSRGTRRIDDALRRIYELGATDIVNWERIPGSQRGSKVGGLFRGGHGELRYVKFYPTPDHPTYELAMLRSYAAAGFDTVDASLVVLGSRVGIASPWRKGLQTGSLEALAQAHPLELARLYAFSVKVDNVDFLGWFDNVGYDPAIKRLVVIDVGASMLARSLVRLRLRPDPSVRWFAEDDRYRRAVPRIAQLYDPLFERHPDLLREALEVVRPMTMEREANIFATAAVRPALATPVIARLGARREAILTRFCT